MKNLGVSMKIAIPIFGPRVSPRFDHAPSLLLFTVEKGAVVERREVALPPLEPWQRVEQLREWDVQTLICGGIDGTSARTLTTHRIQVIPWVSGDVERALEFFLKGRLDPGLALCPGCKRKQHRWRKGFPRGGKKKSE